MSNATMSDADRIKAEAEAGRQKAAAAADAKATEAAARQERLRLAEEEKASRKAAEQAVRDKRQAEKARPLPAKPKRTFPFVCVGQQVLLHHNGDVRHPGTPATVLSVGEKGVDLLVYPAGYGGMSQADAVRFCHDPEATPAQLADAGGWDYTQADHRLHALHPELREWPDEDDD